MVSLNVRFFEPEGESEHLVELKRTHTNDQIFVDKRPELVTRWLYKNSDLRIKTVGDQVEINAKHSEKQDAEGSVW